MGAVARVLLDTHVFLWALMQPGRLSDAARAAVESMETEVLVSAASAWEMAIKFRLGKLPEAESAVRGYEAHLQRLGGNALPISSHDALMAGLFDSDHRDPFDRVLAAQAMTRGIPLVSQDPAFAKFPVTVLW